MSGARARVYALLAAGFAYPEADAFAGIHSGRYAAALEDALAEAAPRLRLPALPAAPAGLRRYQAVWLRGFEELCPPYEGQYAPSSKRGALLLEVRAFYRHFGLGAAAGGELEDHLAAELEFMHALAFRRESRRAQSDFLDRHLRTWLPRFAADARGRLPSGFLKGLVTVTARFVMADRP